MKAYFSIIVTYETGCKINESFLWFCDESKDKIVLSLADVTKNVLN